MVKTESDTKSPEQRVAFFITPIGEAGSTTRRQSDLVLDYILEPALVPVLVAKIERADRVTDPRNITPGIIQRITDADLVIADLSGANANVYYELAFAHAFEKPVVHIAKDGETPRFDAQDVKTFSYGLEIDLAQRAQTEIRDAAAQALAQGKHTTLIGRAAQLKAAVEAGDSVAIELSELKTAIQSLASQGRALSSGLRDHRSLSRLPLSVLDAPVADAAAAEAVRLNSHDDEAAVRRWVEIVANELVNNPRAYVIMQILPDNERDVLQDTFLKGADFDTTTALLVATHVYVLMQTYGLAELVPAPPSTP